MIIDEYDFEKTAQAVFIMNPSAQELYSDWQELRSFMVSMAYRNGDKTTSFSTGGFQLTFFKASDGETCCRASVCGSVALQYAEKHWDFAKRLKEELEWYAQ